MGFLFVVGIIAAIFYFSAKSNKTSREKWQAAANLLHLNHVPGGLGAPGTISGLMGGNRIVITTLAKGGGKSSQTYTKYEVQYRQAVPVEFKITRQGALQSIGKVFGMRDIEVGDPAFDDHVLVNGSRTDEIIRLLTPEVRLAIRHLVATYPDVTITNRKITVVKPGKDVEPSVIAHCARRLAAFAGQLLQDPPAGSEGLAAPAAGQKSVPPVIPVPAEPEEFFTIESFDSFKEQIDRPTPPVPEPPESTAIEEEAAAPEPVAAEYADDALDFVQVAEELFGGDAGRSLRMPQRFSEEYKDRTIRGKGELKRIGKFSFDPVFTNGAGVQAVFDVCQLAGTYSKINIVAVVKYDAAEYALLESRIGTSFPIEGKLVAQDAMTHKLFIEASA